MYIEIILQKWRKNDEFCHNFLAGLHVFVLFVEYSIQILTAMSGVVGTI